MKRLIGLPLVFSLACATAPPLHVDPVPEYLPPESAPIVQAPSYVPGQPRVVTLDSRAPLINIRIMITHGSTSEAAGKEGLANLTSDAVTDGGFRSGNETITKERLAEMTNPWGSAARPTVFTSARATTFLFMAPRDVIGKYIADIVRPMLTQPVFAAAEIERLKNEGLSRITSLRSEDLESLGLTAIDEYVLAGTPYEHPVIGTETSMPSLTRDEVVRFYRDFYRPENAIIGISTSDPAVVNSVRDAVQAMNADATTPSPAVTMPKPESFTGRRAVVIEEPNAPAASVHLGFPYDVNRAGEDFWPLYVANVWLGTHRDGFGQLYQKIREERGYNYGDYSYVEYWSGRPASLFQLFNQPREQQYFSIWIRPVKHEHAVHLMKAATYELEQMIRNGLTAEQVEASKKKARVLYLNLAETVPRLVGARVDDAFFGMQRGYLDSYLDQVNAVTAEQVNAAIRKHLSVANVKYVVVTDSAHLQETVAQIRSNTPVYGKSWQEYEFTQTKLADGTQVWQIPEAKAPTVQLDAVWASYPLNVQEVKVGNVKDMFAVGRLLR